MALIPDITIAKLYVADGRNSHKRLRINIILRAQSAPELSTRMYLYCGKQNAKRGYPILDDTSPLINNAYSIANEFIIKSPVNKLKFVGTGPIPGSYWRITVCFLGMICG